MPSPVKSKRVPKPDVANTDPAANETEQVTRERWINRAPREARADAAELEKLEKDLAEVAATAADVEPTDWFTAGFGLPTESPDVGTHTVYLVRTPLQVTALRASGLVAACLPHAVPMAAEHTRALRGLPAMIVVIADASSEGYRASLVIADRLRSAEIPAEVRTWPAETVAGYNVLDEAVVAKGNTARVAAALEALPSVVVPPRPTGGFWWPKGEPFMWPAGYVVGATGVCRVVEDRKTGEVTLKSITPMPVWVGRRFHGADDSDSAIELCAHVDGRTLRRVCAMSEISTASKLPVLTDSGFLGFTSEMAGEIVRYLSAAIAGNLSVLPKAQMARTVGSEFAKRSNVPVAFVHNGERLLPDGMREPVELSPAAGVQPRRWDYYRMKGDAQAWARLLRVYREQKWDVPMLFLLAAVASLLNRPLGIMPMVVQTAGEGGKGKTTLLQWAFSAMGDPTDVVGSMRATDNAMEMRLRFSNDLPLMVDEIGSYMTGPKQDAALEALVYMVSEREGKDRMNRDGGERAQTSWSCNMLATGERDMGELNATGNTGARRRVLSFFGQPLLESTPRVGALVAELNALTAQHHGHAIPLVAQMLLSLDEAGWDVLRSQHGEIVQRYLTEQCAPGIDLGLATAAARTFAAMELAGGILERIFPAAFRRADGSPDDLPTIDMMLAGPWRTTMLRMGAAPRAERSIDALRQFIALRRADFEGQAIALPARLASGVVAGKFGRMERTGEDPVNYVAIIPTEISAYLAKAGYDYGTDVKHWAQRGWIIPGKDGKNTVPTRINGTQVRCLMVRADALAIDEPADPADDAEPTPL